MDQTMERASAVDRGASPQIRVVTHADGVTITPASRAYPRAPATIIGGVLFTAIAACIIATAVSPWLRGKRELGAAILVLPFALLLAVFGVAAFVTGMRKLEDRLELQLIDGQLR